MSILRRLVASKYTRLAVGSTVLTAGLVGYLATRETIFRDFSPQEDSLFKSDLYKRINPHNNPTLHDLCVRRVHASKLRPELVEDAKNGGSRLVEEFCKGMLSGRVFGSQRGIMKTFAERGRLKTELWTQEEIRQGDIVPGTRVGGEFEVVSVNGTSIMLRGGQPKPKPKGKYTSMGEELSDLRDVDVVAELAARIDPKTDMVEFQFKGAFFCGTGVGSKPPLPAAMDPLHRLYARALLREGSQWCLK